MAAIVTQGIVLRYADYREHDRMLTLLSPQHGRVEALCRGCKRPQSPLLSCSEYFAFGEYVLYAGKGRMTVTGCNLTESFYPLREDYDRLKYASYLLSVAEAAAQPGERAVELFTLLARTLMRLCYSDKDVKAVSAAFLLHFAAISGYRPRLSHCVKCGGRIPEGEIRLMDIEEGGLICEKCYQPLTPVRPLSPAQAQWLRSVLAVGIDKTEEPEGNAPGLLLADYVEARMEKSIRYNGLF